MQGSKINHYLVANCLNIIDEFNMLYKEHNKDDLKNIVSAQCQGGFKIRPSKYIMIARKRERFAPLIKARSKRFTIIPRSNHYESKRCKKIRADQTHHGMPTQWAFRLPVVPGSGD